MLVAEPAISKSASFTLMTYNIFLGGAGRMDTITGVVRAVRPDLLGIQEADDEESIAALARAADMQYVYARANTEHHVAFLSRFPIVHMTNHLSPVMRKTMMEAHVLLPNAEILTAYVAHLNAFASRAGERRRVREMDAILAAIAPRAGEPHLLFGDLNSLAPGDPIVMERVTAHITNRVMRSKLGTVRRQRTIAVGSLIDQGISRGLLDTEAIYPRLLVTHVLAAGYTDCYRTIHPDDPGHTFPAATPALRLDYIFAPPAMHPRLLDCVVVDVPGVAVASDHRPLLARFAL